MVSCEFISRQWCSLAEDASSRRARLVLRLLFPDRVRGTMLDAGGRAIGQPRPLRIGLFGAPLCCHALFIGLAMCLVILPHAGVWAQGSMSKAVPEANVNPQPIRIPIVDGANLRYTRLSTSDGLSQTRVDQVVQDNQGFIWLGCWNKPGCCNGNWSKSSKCVAQWIV